LRIVGRKFETIATLSIAAELGLKPLPGYEDEKKFLS